MAIVSRERLDKVYLTGVCPHSIFSGPGSHPVMQERPIRSPEWLVVVCPMVRNIHRISVHCAAKVQHSLCVTYWNNLYLRELWQDNWARERTPFFLQEVIIWIDNSGDEGINWRALIQITRCYITWECLLCIRQADIQLSHPVVWPNYTKKLPWTSNYHYPECQQTDEHWIVAIRAAFAGTFFPDALKCNPFKASKSTPFPLSDSQSQNCNYKMQRIVTGCSDILIYSRSGHKTMKSGYLVYP